jgi:membrane-bound ClpP family serine protease
MTPKELVDALKAELVDGSVEVYRDLLEETDEREVSDAYWKRLLALYDSLSSEHKEALLQVMRQVAVDTVSNVLGVLDGSSVLESAPEQLYLAVDSNRTKRLNGELQDEFLALIEESNA